MLMTEVKFDLNQFITCLSLIILHVCLLSTISDRLVCTLLNVHLNQAPYRRCNLCIAKVSSDIVMAADRGDVSLLALLDLSACITIHLYRVIQEFWLQTTSGGDTDVETKHFSSASTGRLRLCALQ